MNENQSMVALSAQDIALIEAALHTQQKILAVQNGAGGVGAAEKLAELKRLIYRLETARPSGDPAAESWLPKGLNTFWRGAAPTDPLG